MVVTRDMRTKRVLHRLSRAQRDDRALEPSSIPAIRYQLLYEFRQCFQVTLEWQDYPDPRIEALSLEALPPFLASQVEAQNITDGDHLWRQVVPILDFIRLNLKSQTSTRRPRGYPTLFRWFSPETHRSYLFFAFIKVIMARPNSARIYTAQELLDMRYAENYDLNGNILDMLKNKLELGDIVRPKVGRKLTRIPEEIREVSGEVEKAVPMKRSVPRQLDGTDSDWKYRGRSESDDVQSQTQPIPAPCGIEAQKDEGFQRFYRAVVSPTHVRVTAGGRIVPNNRTSSSPVTKWAKDRTVCDGTSVHPHTGFVQPGPWGMPIAQPSFGTVPNIFPGFPHGLVHGMAPPPPQYSLVPWSMSMGGAFALPMVPGAHVPGTNPAVKKHKGSSRSDKQSESGTSEKTGAARAAAPELMDHSRRMLYNGQWMMPPGHQFFPYGVPPPHGFPSPFPVPMMAPQGITATPSSHPTTSKMGQSVENEAPNQTSASNSALPSTNLQSGLKTQHISSIRPSEITKNHIGILRTRLRYLEDQLQFNKHQIDERAVERDAQLTRQQIQLFEKNYESQLSMEESYSKEDQTDETKDSSVPNYVMSSDPAGAGDFAVSFATSENMAVKTAPNDSRPGQNSMARNSHPKSSEDISVTCLDSENSSSKPNSAFGTWKPSWRQTVGGAHSSLPLGAALAAPFRPRGGKKTQSYFGPSRRSVPSSGEASRPSDENSVVRNAEELSVWNGMPKLGRQVNSVPVPYLIGHLPTGMKPDLAQDTDYSYGRELTEDELRARHMYWGKAPPHLQRGLPKFNGKDFYPPSPIKGSSSDERSSVAFSGHQLDIGPPFFNSHVAVDRAALDPFQSMGDTGHILTRNGPGNSTQSESLPRQENNLDDEQLSQVGAKRTCDRRTGRSLDGAKDATDVSAEERNTISHDQTSSDEGEEDRELIFTGRRAAGRTTGKTHNDIWSSMLKNGKSNAAAIPGTVSSTTAQGVLPQYSGYATAALTPAIGNQPTSSPRNITKANDGRDIKVNNTPADRGGENCPPGDVGFNKG